jgi:tetratricopeptide (TPR) repeat protein
MIKEYHLGLLYAANGQDKEAAKFFTQAVERRNVAAALTETYMRAIEGLARVQAKSGDIDVANATAENGLGLLAGHPPLVQFTSTLDDKKKSAPLVKSAQQGTAEVFYNVGSAISRQGGLPFAQGYLQLANFLIPQNDAVLMALANTYSDQKKYVRANELFAEIPESSAYFGRAQLESGLNLNRMDQYPEAEKILGALFDAAPDDGVVALSLGGVYSQHDDHDKAVLLYDRILATRTEPEERDWVLFYRRGISHERSKNWPKAEADFLRALELSPDQPDVLNYLGYSWIDQGINLDDGLAKVKKAVQLKPNSGFIIDSLGWAYYRLGRYEEAVAELTRALELMPSDPVVNDHLGDAFWKADRKLEAVFQWKHALSHKPTAEDEVKIRQKISAGLTH